MGDVGIEVVARVFIADRVTGADEHAVLVHERLLVVAGIPRNLEVDLVVDRGLFDVGQDVDQPVARSLAPVVVLTLQEGVGVVFERRKAALRVVRVVQGQANLLDVVGAGAAASRLTGRLNSRQQQANEHANDGDHDEQFDEREASQKVTAMHCRLPRIATGLWRVCTKHDGLQEVEKNEKRNKQAKQKENKKPQRAATHHHRPYRS